MTVVELAATANDSTGGLDPLGAAAAKWTAIGLSTAPADRDTAVEAVRICYTSVGLPVPKHVLWFDSPMAGARAAALLTGRRGLPGPRGPESQSVDVAALVEAQGCPPSPGSAGVSVRAAVRTEPWSAARDQVRAALGPDGWARLWTACGADVWRSVTDHVAAPLRGYLRGLLPALVGGADPASAVLLEGGGGQHDAGWLAVFDAAEPSIMATGAGPTLVRAAQRLTGLGGLARSTGWWWPYAEVAILTERPDGLERDNDGRLHSATGPALRYRDGFTLHAWHGEPMPDDLPERLHNVTRRRILGEPDPELRRVLLEHYGYGRFMREGYAHRVAADDCGVLWRAPLGERDDDEPLLAVEVTDAGRTWWLRVPPQTRTAREGVAWTFGLTEEQYAPLVEA
jgi:hypothetical protein